MKCSESIVKISQALLKAQSEMGNAVKGGTNPFFKSKYADLNSVREACIPVLNKHGVMVLQPNVFIDGKPFVETVLLHESGEFISGVTEIVCKVDNDPQQKGSSTTYSRRFGLMSMLNIGTSDDDAEAAMGRKEHPVKTSFQKKEEVSNIFFEVALDELHKNPVVESKPEEAKPKRVGFMKPIKKEEPKQEDDI